MTDRPQDDPLWGDLVVQTWRFWLTELAGWTDEEILAFVNRWRDRLVNKESMMFNHEEIEYWISPQLVPEHICRQHSGYFVERVAWCIYPPLVRYRHAYGLTTNHIDSLRAELREAIDQRIEELRRANVK